MSRTVGLAATLWLGLTILVPQPAQAQVVLNEIMTANQAAYFPYPDDPNAVDYAPDYVELYNTSGTDVDLGVGPWSLHSIDDAETNYVFQAGTIVPANGFLVVFLDDDTSFPGIHAGFNIRASRGDTIALFNGALLADSQVIGMQMDDFSVGAVPDNNGVFQLNTPTPGQPNQAVTLLGDPLKLRINEWQALGIGSGRGTNDWIELYNPETNAVALGGLIIDDAQFGAEPGDAIRQLSFIAPLGYAQFLLVDNANDADELEHLSLSSTSGDNIYLFADFANAAVGNFFDHVPTSRVGATLPVKPNETEGRVPDGGTNIIVFRNSTPNDSNFGPIDEIIISEVLPHTDPPFEDAIELYNPTSANVNIGGWWLSNGRNDPMKFQIPADTILPPGGFKTFYEFRGEPGGFNPNGAGTNRSFTLNSSDGDELYLFKADSNGTLLGFRRGIDFPPSENAVSFGRHITSEGEVDIVPMASRSFGVDTPGSVAEFRAGAGRPNPYPLVGPVVINEIHYRPPPDVSGGQTNDNSRIEFVELKNVTDAPVPLFYFDQNHTDCSADTWRIRGDIEFNFPGCQSIPANGYVLLVNFDPVTNLTQLAEFQAAFPGLPVNAKLYGPYKNKLRNGGGVVELKKPDSPQMPDRGGFTPYVLVDRVNYDDELPWPESPDGFGDSLQRSQPNEYGNDPANWKAGLPTPARANGPANLPPPTVAMQPQDVTVAPGATANLTASGNGQLLAYRWLYENVPMLNATNATLTLPNVTPAQAGQYRVRISNPAGDVLSAQATLTVQAGGSDTTKPTVIISSPAANARLTEAAAVLRGTASDKGGVLQVEVSLNNGAFEAATGTTSWEAPLTLVPGTNTVRVRATDNAGNVSTTVSRNFFYARTAPFNVTTIGQGTISGATNGQPLEVGRRYTITAVPAAGWLFSDWAGDVASTSASLTFTMQELFGVVATFIPNPFIPTKGTYNGLFHEMVGVQHASAGFFSLKLKENGSYTATIQNAGKRYSAKGTFGLNGQAMNVIPRLGLTPLTVNWQLALDGSDQITGSVTDSNWLSSLLGDRATWNKLTNPAPYGNRYTVVIPGLPGAADKPEGDSYGTATVDGNGLVNLRAFLADGTSGGQRVALSKNGDMPLYLSLDGGRSSALAWVRFSTSNVPEVSAQTLSWNKAASATAKFYRSGFMFDTSLTGSRFVAPAIGGRVLNLNAGTVTLTGGNLADALTNDFALGPSSKVTNGGPHRLTLTFSPSAGTFSGSLTPTNSIRAIPIKGVVLQSSTNAFGYFAGTNATGRVAIEMPPAAP